MRKQIALLFVLLVLLMSGCGISVQDEFIEAGVPPEFISEETSVVFPEISMISFPESFVSSSRSSAPKGSLVPDTKNVNPDMVNWSNIYTSEFGKKSDLLFFFRDLDKNNVSELLVAEIEYPISYYTLFSTKIFTVKDGEVKLVGEIMLPFGDAYIEYTQGIVFAPQDEDKHFESVAYKFDGKKLVDISDSIETYYDFHKNFMYRLEGKEYVRVDAKKNQSPPEPEIRRILFLKYDDALRIKEWI